MRARAICPSLSFAGFRRSANVVRPQSSTSTSAPKKHSPAAVRELIDRRASEFLESNRTNPALQRLVKAQNNALQHILDTLCGETIGETIESTSYSSSLDLPFDSNANQTHPRATETLDVLFKRTLLLLQAKKGYRCNVDSLILAAHVSGVSGEVSRMGSSHEYPRVDGNSSKKKTKIADLGAGSGVVGILCTLSGHGRNVDSSLFVERQVELASRCERNVQLNGLREKATVVRGDVLEVFDDDKLKNNWLGTCDAVAVNPPYYQLNSARGKGTLPSNTERLEAHYETSASLFEFAKAARKLLRVEEGAKKAEDCEDSEEDVNADSLHRPAAHFVYPADAERLIIEACAQAGLGDITVRKVYTDSVSLNDKKPALVLVDAREGVKKEKGTIFPSYSAQPLVLYADEKQLKYCPEIEQFMENLGLE